MNLEQALEIFDLKSLSGLTSKSLKNLYKNLAKAKHPDQGGNTSEFVKLREAYLFLITHVGPEENLIIQNDTDIKSLSKEEIIDKYFQDTEALRTQINTFQIALSEQVHNLDQIRLQIADTSKEFDSKKERLQKEFETKVASLEKVFTPSIWKKFFFFLPRMNEEEFWGQYHVQVEKYSQKNVDLDSQFLRDLLNIYGDGLNSVAQVIQDQVQ